MKYQDLASELKKRGYSGGVTTGNSTTSNGSYAQQLVNELKKRGYFENEQSDISASSNRNYPQQLVTELQKRGYQFGQTEEQNNEVLGGYFSKGAFADGYQFGDFTKTVLGTATDIENDLKAGLLGILEGTIDAGAYLVGGIGKLFGADEFSEKVSDFIQKDIIDEEKIASANLATSLLGGAEQVEANSLLGHKMDSVAQSGGQMLGQMGLQAVGIPWWVTSGVTSFGGQVEQALGDEASYLEAGGSGLVSAGAEIISEKLFGGSGLGEKGLINTEALTKGISNKALKTLADFGVDVASEGAEEVVSEIFSNLGTALYKEENIGEILGSEEALQSYLDSFIGGAIMGGVANASNAVKSVKNKTDYRNGMTANEQKVFDSVYENAVKEAQEKKGDLTKKEKAAIYDKTLEDMAKGYISTETIEKAVGGEAYEQYQNLLNEYNEYSDLYDTPYEKLSEKQRDRLAELKEKNKANSYDDAIYNAYENLKKQVTDGGKSFKESYNERGRRAQKFDADVSQYDEKYRSTVQKAIDSGILNNTNRSHEFVDLVSKISAETGTQFDFANNKKLAESGLALEGLTVNGVTTGDGVTINMDSAKALNTVVGHEVTHILEGTDMYNALQTAIFDYAKSKGEFDSRRAALEKLYKDVEGADIDAELTADLVGDYLFTDKAFLENLSTKHRNVFQKIYDQIKRLCKLATAGSKEARQLEEVKKAFEEVYREAGNSETTKNTAENGGVKYSISETFESDIDAWDGKSHKTFTVGETSDVLKSLGVKDSGIVWHSEKISRIMQKHPEMTKSVIKQVPQILENPVVVLESKQSNSRLVMFGTVTDTAGKPVTAILELQPTNKGGQILDMNVIASAYGKNNAKNLVQNSGLVYLDTNVKRTKSWMQGVGLQLPADTSAFGSVGSITYQDGKVKIESVPYEQYMHNRGNNADAKYSLSDSQGRKLSNDQAEYFRNAKTVDENGNLKPFYHGTARADRVGYYFNPERATSGPMAYFTDSKKIADNYAKDKADTSLAYDEVYDDYYTQFRMNVNGKDMSVSEAWKQLPFSKRNEIREKAKHITMDEDYSGVIYDENAQYGPGGLDAYTINAHRGNVLEALTEAWLESGTIYGEEQMFLDVLKLAGLDDVQYMNPDFRAEKTYEVYLNITNPFDASNISSEMVDALREAADNAEYEGGNAADMWDKRNVDPAEWIERMERDIENGTTHAWTSIPDFVTDTLKAHGYDGIFDKGGKNGGDIHTVAIPFYSEQIKDVDNRTPTVNPDIRYSLSPEGDGGAQYGDYNVYGEDITTPDWNDIAPPVETAQTAETTVGDDIAPPVEAAQNAETAVGDDIAPPVENVQREATTNDIAPTREEIAKMDEQRAAQQNDIAPDVNAVNDDIAPVGNSIAELQTKQDSLNAQLAELFERMGNGSDPQWQQEYLNLKDQFEAVSEAIKNWERQASDVELSKNAVTNISRAVRKTLGLSNKQMADARGLIEKYSDMRIPSREQLYSEVSELFGEHSEKIVNEELKQAQKDIRAYGISVSEDIKSQIADYNDLRKRNFGKIRFSKDGMAVDAAYQELQEIAPGFFPNDIINPADQLMRIVDVANMQEEMVNKFDIDADTLWQATDEIINGVNEYKHKKLERMAAKQDIAPVDLNAVLKNSQNRRSSVGVPLEDLAPPIDTANGQQTFTQEAAAEADAEANRLITHAERQHNLVEEVKTVFKSAGYDLDEVLKNGKDLSTFATVDNTPQRVMEKALGWHEGKIMADLTVNRVAQHESEAIKWVNSMVDRIKTISKDHNIKPGSKESAAAQMYAEGFWVNKKNEIVAYGDTELAKDFPNAQVQKNIKALAADTRVRQILDETLDLVNESRVRNGYAPIKRLDNYFLHFWAPEDLASKLGLPFNLNDIREKDLPTDLNGVTADLKPGQPYFASAQHRNGKRTSFDLLGGLEMYINSAKNQIYHIDDIQMLRALRNYIADTYGQAKGLESIDTLSEEAAQERIKEIYNSHLSTFAKFLNEEANVIAGKTSLVDRGLEGILGRRGIQILEKINRQVGANMVGFNVSSSLTNLLSVVQATAKTSKHDMLKALVQTASNRLTGKKDAFIENNPTVLRRRGAERFYRTPWQKISDIGYALAGAVDDVATELIVRGKYNELTRKGMDSQTAIAETDKLVSRLMGDRSLGQQPQIYNSKTLGIFTKFQLEGRNQLDAIFYDTIQESKSSTENITNEMKRNATAAAKATSTLVQLAVLQHLFGTAFEAVTGYNPAFDIISVLMTAIGWGDDDDSEDTTLDNLEQAFLELLDDLPYTSTLTGGRVPIASALPIEELVTGKDSYGNEKSRLETVAEALPYYLLPGGYSQAKKTIKGLSMFDDDLPVTGSYTDSGNLRFPVEDTVGNRIQAALFGQYANENGREYFDNNWSTLKEKQISEYAELGVSVKDYRKIRSEMSKIEGDKDTDGNTISGSKKKKVVQYIDGLDLTAAQKVTLYNGQYESENDQVLERLTTNFDDEDYWAWLIGLSSIESDKDTNGNTISGSRKEKAVELLNSLEYLDYGQKIILFRSEFTSDDTYCADIVEYINELSMSYEGRVEILKALGFRISDDGTKVYW